MNLCWTQPCSGAITLDSVDSYSSNGAAVSGVTLAHTVTGILPYLLMQSQVDTTGASASITSATYNGVPLTRIRRDTSVDTNQSMETWGLVNPASGPGSLVMQIAGSQRMHVAVLSYQGVDQANPVGATAFTTLPIASTNATLSITTLNALSEIVSMCTANGPTTFTPGLPQVQRWTQSDNDATEGDDKLTVLAGLYSMSYMTSSSQNMAVQAVEIGANNAATDTPTSTVTNTATPTATATATTTPTDSPTATPSPTASSTGIDTATATPTSTHTVTSTPSATATNTLTATLSSTPTGTATDTPPTSPTPTPTPTKVPAVSPNPFTPMLSTAAKTYFNVPATHGSGEFIIMTLRQKPMRTVRFDPGTPVGWDGKDDAGQVVPGGLYLYLLKVDGQSRRGTIAVFK